MVMKRNKIALAVLLMLAAGCGIQTESYQDNLVMPLTEGSPDSLFFSMRVEYVADGIPAEAREQINAAIVSHAFDLEGGSVGSLEEAAVTYRENLIDEYLTENGAPEQPDGLFTWEDKVDGTFTGRYKGWLNYLLTYYSFRGGAHGIQTMCQVVFDKGTGAVVTQEDLFAPGYEEPLAALLKDAVMASLLEEDPELAGLLEPELIVPNGNIALGKDGVQWIFQPYEVGPYALGIVMATLPWEQLKPYLK